MLGVYALRVTTPRDSTAVTDLGLKTALHPPTYAVRDEETGVLRQTDGKMPGFLSTDPIGLAPPGAPDGHPFLNALDLPRFHVRGPGERLFEKSFNWARPMADEECTLHHLVGLTAGLGVGAAEHVSAIVFGPKLPSRRLVDLPHVDLSRVEARHGQVGGPGGQPAFFQVHSQRRAPDRTGLVRDGHRRPCGGSRPRGAPRQRPLPGRLVCPAERCLPHRHGRPRGRRGPGVGRVRSNVWTFQRSSGVGRRIWSGIMSW
ncbi:hypothetical protein [Streptomyces sp. NPDC050504]|uniref:hypothetical protein n=1 Tax=Streptomyces sp. NPDC050504 TaxID=3365618 RepID=UPI0037ABCE25